MDDLRSCSAPALIGDVIVGKTTVNSSSDESDISDRCAG